MNRITTDVLIIGGGSAALRAAISAKENYPEGDIVIVTKGILGKSGITANACSDRMAFHATLPSTLPNEPENWRYHADDIYEIGGHVSDKDLAEILAKNSAEAFYFLDKLGVSFKKKENGTPDQFLTDGSIYPRALYTGPYTAQHIEEVLVKKVKSMDIKILEHNMLIKIVLNRNKNSVAGALLIDKTKENEEGRGLCLIKTNNIILATGGAGAMFKINVFTPDLTGDSYALAYDIGAELTNLEFIQIGLSSVKTKLACSGSIMRSIPRMVNDQGEEFLKKYFPEDYSYDKLYNVLFTKGFNWPVSVEHISSLIDVAVYKEVIEGKRVFLDFSQNPKNFHFNKLAQDLRDYYFKEQSKNIGEKERRVSPLNRLKEINPEIIQWFKKRRIDIEGGDKVEIAPAIQHFQGGIKIREKANTNIEGLYVAGEVAGGQHGANRPGGNALLDCQVFGKIAGEEAAKRAINNNITTGISVEEIKKVLEEFESIIKSKGLKASEVRKKIQKIMYNATGVVRTSDKLTNALEELNNLKKEGLQVDYKGISFAIETKNMFTIAEMILRSCNLRKESRGPHLYFNNYNDLRPIKRKEEWDKYIVIFKKNKEMVLKKRKPIN
jgi:succinate dehydrogenase / fumarate reductase flavoprotein subunit